jgi:hypothetical protein
MPETEEPIGPVEQQVTRYMCQLGGHRCKYYKTMYASYTWHECWHPERPELPHGQDWDEAMGDCGVAPDWCPAL